MSDDLSLLDKMRPWLEVQRVARLAALLAASRESSDAAVRSSVVAYDELLLFTRMLLTKAKED